MNTSKPVNPFSDILVVGQGRLAASIPVCLAAAGSRVTLQADSIEELQRSVSHHAEDLDDVSHISPIENIKINLPSDDPITQSLAIVAGYSNEAEVGKILENLEKQGTEDLVIAVETDHIPLHHLQQNRSRPENILVVNWTEPAHTTFFLEIVHNNTTKQDIVDRVEENAIHSWGKDPYKVHSELGVRGLMNAAMIREALYLIDVGYANVEDIDRACRNDAGTYLPFAGNFQYMDLMGTYAYGVVMEQLNKELSNATVAPDFFHLREQSPIDDNGEYQPGFYQYTKEDIAKWETRMRSFSFEVRSVMEKYPFHYLDESD